MRAVRFALIVLAAACGPWLPNSPARAGDCQTLCFRSPQYFLSRLDALPRGAVVIGGVNLNAPVDTRQRTALGRALGGDASILGSFNRQFVAAQLSLLGAPAVDGALGGALSCYGLDFAPQVLSSGSVLRPESTLGEVWAQARAAARAGSGADLEALAGLLARLNGGDPLGRCQPPSPVLAGAPPPPPAVVLVHGFCSDGMTAYVPVT